MEQRKDFDIDGIRYAMTPANAYGAWETLQLLLGAIGRSKMDHPGDGSISGAIALAFSVMDRSEMAAVQTLVFDNAVLVPEQGMPSKLSDCGKTHFNQYRAHLPQLLVEGAVYQFSDFFYGIRDVLTGLFPGMGKMLEFLEKARELVEPLSSSMIEPQTETSTGSSGPQ